MEELETRTSGDKVDMEADNTSNKMTTKSISGAILISVVYRGIRMT